MRPSSVDTSDPAWVNRKMLSMKSSTSCFCTSRKYSAIVSADSATRRRVPGGSSIWPNTSAVLSKTPASSISWMRSLPSRVRSPTPANTDTPPWSCATRWIISWISTVLPTPAPPNRPILPPCTYGVSRSMTLMPVSSISVLPSSWSNDGALRWMPQRSPVNFRSGASRQSPSALNTWPSTWPATSAVPSFALVCPSNWGSVSLTLTTAVRPSRTSSPDRFPSDSLRTPWRFAQSLRDRVSARRKPVTCDPPTTVLMLFAKASTFSAYESLYWSATSIVVVPSLRSQ